MKNILTLLIGLLFYLIGPAQTTTTVTFNHEGKTVNASLVTPNGPGPYATIILNPGTGANDRDGTFQLVGGNAACLFPGLQNQTLKMYKGLGDALVDSGYAVLRYDKLEYTYQSPTALGPVTFRKLWLPVESALDFIKTRPEIDTNQIVLIGHSEGSSLIPYIARQRNDVQALISIGGPRTPFDTLLANQLVLIADSCNGDVAAAQSQANQILGYYDIIRNNNWNAQTPPLFGASAAVWDKYLEVIDSVVINYNLANLPSLFIGMEMDFNVPPLELLRFQNEVNITNDFWSLSGLNHYMTPANSPLVSEVLTDTVVYWLRQQGVQTSQLTVIDDKSNFQVFPNPFREKVQVEFYLTSPASGKLVLVNMMGKEILHKSFQAGSGKVHKSMEIGDLPVGVYHLELRLPRSRQSQKVVHF